MPERPARTVLGFDFGLKRIGVAVGQTLTASAGPLTTLAARNGVPDWAAIAKLIAAWKPAALVVGLPYNADHSEQPMTAQARDFARELSQRFALPVHDIDERLSSREAQARLKGLRQQGRRRVRRAEVDSAAACVILESWLQNRKPDSPA